MTEPSNERLSILVVSIRFPPTNMIGAVRVAAVAGNLARLGHEVHVLTVKADPGQSGTEPDPVVDSITRTSLLAPRKSASAVSRRQRDAIVAAESGLRAPRRSGAFRAAKWLRKNVLWLPDDYVAWLPIAVVEGARLCRKHDVDVVFASAWPVTSLIAAHLIARSTETPWVGELRDFWTGNHYAYPRLHQEWLDTWLERRVLATAAGLVTVSEEMATVLRGRQQKPTLALFTGYEESATEASQQQSSTPELVLAYTGQLYGVRRDPAPLFTAIARMGGDSAGIRVVIAGPDSAYALAAARRLGLGRCVGILPQVSHHDALVLQERADVLLLLLWNTPKETGVVTGKLFEYLAFNKPILVVGAPQGGEAANLVADRRLGVASNSPADISACLAHWREQKRVLGYVPLPEQADKKGLSRMEQAKRLEAYLFRLLKEGA